MGRWLIPLLRLLIAIARDRQLFKPSKRHWTALSPIGLSLAKRSAPAITIGWVLLHSGSSSSSDPSSFSIQALPSTAAVTRNNRITELEEELRVATAKATELENALDAARKARPESADRTTKLAMLDAARKAKAEIDSELQKYADNDPAVYEARSGLAAGSPWLDFVV